MKLNRETRGEVRIGTRLRHGDYCVRVASIEPSGRFLQGLSIVAVVVSWSDDAWGYVRAGDVLPSEALSRFYGDEIDNTEEFTAGVTLWDRWSKRYATIIRKLENGKFLCSVDAVDDIVRDDAVIPEKMELDLEQLVYYRKV